MIKLMLVQKCVLTISNRFDHFAAHLKLISTQIILEKFFKKCDDSFLDGFQFILSFHPRFLKQQ